MTSPEATQTQTRIAELERRQAFHDQIGSLVLHELGMDDPAKFQENMPLPGVQDKAPVGGGFRPITMNPETGRTSFRPDATTTIANVIQLPPNKPVKAVPGVAPPAPRPPRAATAPTAATPPERNVLREIGDLPSTSDAELRVKHRVSKKLHRMQQLRKQQDLSIKMSGGAGTHSYHYTRKLQREIKGDAKGAYSRDEIGYDEYMDLMNRSKTTGVRKTHTVKPFTLKGPDGKFTVGRSSERVATLYQKRTEKKIRKLGQKAYKIAMQPRRYDKRRAELEGLRTQQRNAQNNTP